MRRTSTRANAIDGLERREFTPVGRACRETLNKTLHLPTAAWFKEQVREDVAPNYYRIIKKPMYFGLVQQNLDTFKYSTVADFVRDVRQIFMNAVLYNSPETEVCKAAQQVSEIFEKEFANRVLPISGEACSPLYEFVIPEATRPQHEAIEQIFKILIDHATCGSLPNLASSMQQLPPPPQAPLCANPLANENRSAWVSNAAPLQIKPSSNNGNLETTILRRNTRRSNGGEMTGDVTKDVGLMSRTLGRPEVEFSDSDVSD